MGDDNKDFQIKIGTEYDGTGAQEAKQDLGELSGAAEGAGAGLGAMGKEAGEVGKVGEKLGLHTFREVAHAAHGVETAAEGGHMSMIRWAMSLRALFALMLGNPLIAFATAIGAVAIAIGVWIAKSAEARAAIKEDMDKTQEAAAETARKMEEAQVVAKYDAVREALASITAEYEKQNAALDRRLKLDKEIGKALLDQALAQKDLEELRDLEDAKNDPIKQEKIKAQYDQERRDLQHGNQTADADNELEAIHTKQLRNKQLQQDLLNQTLTLSNPQEKEKAYGDLSEKFQAALKESGLVSNQQRLLDELATLRSSKEPLTPGQQTRKSYLEMSAATNQSEAKEKLTFDEVQKKEAEARIKAIPKLERELAFAQKYGDEASSEAGGGSVKSITTNLQKAYAEQFVLEGQKDLESAKISAETERKEREKSLKDITKKRAEESQKEKDLRGDEKVILEKNKAQADQQTAGQAKGEEKSKEQIAQATEREADRKRKEAEDWQKEQDKKRKEYEKAGGPQVEAEGRGAAGMLSGLDMGGTSPTATALRIATEKFKQHPTDPALQKAEDDALHAFIQAATSRWDRELAAKAMQMERQIAALRKATDDLNNRVSNLNTP